MTPKISAKFRKRHDIPYAIEQLSGRQYRCRHCNRVFLSIHEIDRHLNQAIKSAKKSKLIATETAPEINSNINVHLIYCYDLYDKLRNKWLKLKPGDEYDGI
jgi:transcription elongation factor Elf1